ncbi:hypothetical protein [Nitrospirillum pindoramense]|uniref:Uncharacterized protein n=1 Tax=Nitrospirillum amazonense TaxID=28077 RepID=A0A560HG22_9PROT|nr:hypothetical protein [Nitrospirillum amazonense]TWB44290.1 hypothetical protein FBZ90_103196 [Nitrospirillum amazonense]
MDGWQRRYRLSNGPGGLGVSCTGEGLALAGVPLLAKGAGGFRARPAAEVAVLLGRAYAGAEPGAAVLPGLAKIADALNRGDLAQAMIRAVHLRLPELDWDAAVRLTRANDNLAKYSPDQLRDDHGRWTTEGGGAEDAAKPQAGLALRTNAQAQGAPHACGVLRVEEKDILPPAKAKELFNSEYKKLQDEGLLSTQGFIEGKILPNFEFVPQFGSLRPGDRALPFSTLKAAKKDADKYNGKIVGGYTEGNYSQIFLTAAAPTYIPGLGYTTPQQTMRFAILHEWGHQQQGGQCRDSECCADSYALEHMGGKK